MFWYFDIVKLAGNVWKDILIQQWSKHFQTSQERLREYFGQFGEVDDVLIMKDPITQVHNIQ